MNYTVDKAVLRGTADSAVFWEIDAVEIESIRTGKSCTLYFADGGQTQDAVIETLYDSISSLNLKWTKETRLYNGAMADFDVNGHCNFYFINTYPYGFLLIDGSDIYFYQKSQPTE
ncbi:MAG: hypothetical protein IJU16_01295 [Clostridia bacterium]|nr:hypothetical protein [Clostridia bacterium]